ncbi:MAG: dynamin family protein [Deltaproteobacteria bacterium]|nr:dynamin family protein [Deltaproteobacteria bacterium]
MKTFTQQAERLKQLAVRLSPHLRAHGVDDAAIRVVVDRVQSEPFRVVVIGEFSRGKSTFVNALVGEKVLPSSVRPTTAVITVIRHGSPRSAVVQWRDAGRPSEVVSLPEGAAAKELDRIVTTKNASPEEVARVEITLPLPHFGLPFELVDTPGVNDIDTAREEITYGYLTRADAALMLLDMHQPFSASERRFLVEKVLGNDLRKILFVVNKIDQEPPEKLGRALSYIQQRLADIEGCRDAVILPVAAKLGLAGKQGDPAALEQSRLPDLERRLVDFLTEASGRSRIDTAARRVVRVAQGLIEELTTIASGLDGQREALELAVAASAGECRAATQRQGAVANDIEAITASFNAEAAEQMRGATAAVRRDAATIAKRPTFPSEADADAIRRVLNEGLRRAVAIPSDLAATAANKALRRRDYQRSTALTVEHEVILDAGVEAQVKAVGAQIGGAIGGAIGWALLGPFGGIPLGILGGWIGSELGERPSGSKIQASLATALAQIDARAQSVLTLATADLRERLVEELVRPAEAAVQRSERGHRELSAANSASASERSQRVGELRAEIAKVQAIMDDLLKIGSAS